MIANPFYNPANPRSKLELDLSKQANRLFVLLKEEIISYQDKTERFDFIRLKGNTAAHEDAENPYTEADAAPALDHFHALCRQMAEHYPSAQPPRAPCCSANPAAAQPLQNRAAPYRSGSGMAAGMTIAAVVVGVLFAFYILSSLAKRPSEKRETAAAPAAPAPENNILRYPDGSVYRGGIVNGLAAARYQLGTMYEQGRGVSRDTDAAAAWYLAAAGQNYAPAVARLKAAAETAPPEKSRSSGSDTLNELF